MIIRIATRQSPLALWQSQHVSDLLRSVEPGIEIELVTLETHADQRLDIPISELGGKGAFSKEVQARVFLGEADLAVHSAKDLQAVTPKGLTIAAFPKRGDVRDALVGSTLDDLPMGATVATGSNRRQAMLANLRPDLRFEGLRGNIGTRLSKASGYDAIVMAAAALERLGEHPDKYELLDAERFIPQVGQGALAVECRENDSQTIELLSRIDHGPTRVQLEVERAFMSELGGDCDLPAGANCCISLSNVDQSEQLIVRAMLADMDENRFERIELDVDESDHTAAGVEAARALRTRLQKPL